VKKIRSANQIKLGVYIVFPWSDNSDRRVTIGVVSKRDDRSFKVQDLEGGHEHTNTYHFGREEIKQYRIASRLDVHRYARKGIVSYLDSLRHIKAEFDATSNCLTNLAKYI
jgi:hypothetical protein